MYFGYWRGEWYYIYKIPDRIAHSSKRGPNRLHRRRNVHSLHWSKLRIYHQPISPKKEGNEGMYLFYVYPILLLWWSQQLLLHWPPSFNLYSYSLGCKSFNWSEGRGLKWGGKKRPGVTRRSRKIGLTFTTLLQSVQLQPRVQIIQLE